MSADVSELRALAAFFDAVPPRVGPKVQGVVSKGALNVKKQLVKDTQGSTHFKSVGRSIGYDLNVSGDSTEAVVGPDKSRSPSAGLLGAYWGWSRGGGGTLPDPIIALGEEEPRFLENMAQIVGFIFD